MLKNYIKMASRNLIKHKFFSLINIFGLAIGIAAFWLITLYVIDESSYDRYHEKADRIFRVVQHGKWNGGEFNMAVTSAPFAPTLKNDYPEVEDAVRINAEGGGSLDYQGKQIDEGSMLFADQGFFNLFTYRFLSGDPLTALAKPNSIVLTATVAEKLFGDSQAALDKILLIDKQPNTVTGIVEDVPFNSHFRFNALRSFPANYTDRWSNASMYTYLLLKNTADAKKIEAGSDAFLKKYLLSDMGPMQYRMELQPLKAIHLTSNLDYELGPNGNINQLYVFVVVALLILAMAVINYVNLTTARSSIRMKEIGIRRVIGSSKKQLLFMFFAESILLSLIATGIAVMLIYFTLPYFNSLSGKTLSVMSLGIIPTIAVLFLFSLISGILCGFYPAWFLSGFRTMPALKGQAGDRTSTILFRKSLMVFQFIITIVMIASSYIIYRQMDYVINKDLGFNKEQVLTFHINNRSLRSQTDAIKARLLQNPAIERIGIAGNPIGNNDIGSGDFNLGPDGKANSESKVVQSLDVDEDFIPALQIRIAKGRNFSPAMGTDKVQSIIINETLANELGWKDPVGKMVRTGVDANGAIITQQIIGVVKDFNTYSLQHKVAPVVLQMPQSANDKDNLYVRINKNNIPATLDYISKTYGEFDPESKIEYHFLDQNFARQYQSEEKQSNILFIFTLLAIFISCLGLFGLVTFTAEQKVKEIGIRKVLGASVSHIIALLSTDIMKLVLVAVVIASPIAWYGMSRWLQNFAYRTNMDWWIFILSGIVILCIALATICLRAIKAATANPVKSLRAE